MVSTKERLADELGKAGAPDWMIEKARFGFYDDYESPIATPCIQLVMDLQEEARMTTTRSIRDDLKALAERAKNGEFDATPEESDAWYEREGKDLIKDFPPGMREMFERKPNA